MLHYRVYHWTGIFYQLESILFIHLLLAQHCGRQVFLCLLMTCAGCNSLGLIELPEEKGSVRVDGWKPWHQLLDCQTQQNWSCSSRAPGQGRSVQSGQLLSFPCKRRTSHVLQIWGKGVKCLELYCLLLRNSIFTNIIVLLFITCYLLREEVILQCVISFSEGRAKELVAGGIF